jgi:DNA-binding transcriptional regulator YdaS (Cro superfamily)
MTEKKMMAEVRRLIRLVGSQKQAAIQLGITPQYLNDILHQRREISTRVADAMGYDRIVSYRTRKASR